MRKKILPFVLRPMAAAMTAALLGYPLGALAINIEGGQTVIVPDTQSSPWNVGGNLLLGINGDGTLIIQNGGIVASSIGYLGAGSTGNVVVSGNGSLWQTGTIYVGHSNDSHGILTIENGGVVNAGVSYIGRVNGTTGQVLVSGAGSSLSTGSGSFFVGYGGVGSLKVENGAKVSTGLTLGIGYNVSNQPTGEGMVTVDGVGSSVNSTTTTVGSGSNGQLTIQNGAAVTNNNGNIGNTGILPGTGTVMVTGSGSTWTNMGTLTIGRSPGRQSGALYIENGGLVSANNVTGNGVLYFDQGTLRALSSRPDFINLTETDGLQLLSGGAVIDSNGFDISSSNAFTGVGSLTKQGAGTLLLNMAQQYTGATIVNAGTLQTGVANAFSNSSDVIVNGGILNLAGNAQLANRLSGSGGTIALNGATLTANNASATDNTLFAGTITGGDLIKTGAGQLTLTNNNTFGNVTVQQGTLQFSQASNSSISGDYTAQDGATTNIGQVNSTLSIGGTFTQQAGSILSATLGASPDITAQRAQLGGTLLINGFSDGPVPVTASDVVQQGYVFIHTIEGILGDFTNNPLVPSGVDYLIHEGQIANGGLDYELDFRLAWTQGDATEGTGDFTLGEDSAFNVDIALVNQTVPDGGFSSGWDGQSLVKNGVGRLLLSAQNSYTGSTTVNDGVLQFNLADSIVPSSNVIVNGGVLDLNGYNQQFNRLAGSGGEIQLNGASLNAVNTSATDDSVYTGNITGGGTFIKSGAGSLTLSGKTAWSGNTELQGGSLILDGSSGGAQLTSNIIGQSDTQLTLHNGAGLTGWIDPTNVALDATSHWNLTANSLVNNLSNSGTVTFVAPTASDFKTLTVEGNYQGNNGLLVLNTRLGDDASLTDKLIVAGNTSGNTRVQINNAGGSGAESLNGIEVISVAGQSDGEFVQTGRITAGAYDYSLGRGSSAENAQNWYLTSHAAERPEAGGYAANLSAANNMFVTGLHDREGERQFVNVLTGEQETTSMWLRNEGGHNRSRDTNGQLRTQANRYVMQLGGEIAQWSSNGVDRLHLGAMAGYGNSKNSTTSQMSGYNAKSSIDGYSLGVYGTWYANEADKVGLYVDSWAQYSWFNNSVDGQGLASEEYKSKGVTASVESGYTFKVGENAAKNATYFVQPKAQITWMGVKADDHKEANGTNVSGEGDGNIQTRLGVKAFMNGYAAQDKGKDRVFQPFVEANWIHNSKDFGTNMDGILVKQDGAANIVELKLGVEGQINKRVNLWGNLGQQVGNKGYSDTSAMLGVKYKF
ncbi:autotransporter outer membrane beta-barrel domain-containing protein [Serratia aquatilis]|uniref:Autotransporter outer membrane beta-barrel domain-containing protein n=1 Tax=Serratia aquatilis TaxID=1737515 RepID=A0ABV6EDC8_9GAMM